MSEAGFTKGPWRFSNEDGQRSIRTGSDDAERFGCPLMSDPTYYPWCPEADADWHLIAAAPDMLQALQVICEELQDGNDFEARQVARFAGRAAIAKALGRI